MDHYSPCLDEDSPQSFGTPDDMMKEILRLRGENAKIQAILNDKGSFEKARPQESSSDKLKEFNSISEKMEKTIKDLSSSLAISESKKAIIKEALIKYIIKSEDQLKKEKSIWVKEQLHRLGRYSVDGIGLQYKRIWEDGEEFK